MSDNPHSGFYEAETSRTLDRSGGDPTCNQGGICVVEPVAFTQNQRDEIRDLGEKSAALAAEPGMKQQTFVLQGNMIGRKDENGPQGDGVNEDVCFTLDATDRHAVCAPEDVYAMTTGSYMQVAKEVAPTLMARDYKDPTTIAPVPHLNEGVMGTVATGAHPSGFNGQDAFNDRLVIDNPEAQPAPVTYTVRRLTPTECARLQGFPDWWCRDLGTEDPTEEDLAFWADVFETHRNKKEGTKGLYRSLGSIDVVAAARSVLQVERDAEKSDIRIVRQIKNSLAPSDGEIKFSITAEQGFKWLECEIKPDPSAEPETPVFESKSEKAAYLIKKLLSGGDMRSREIYMRMSDEGISRRTAENTKKELGIRSYRKMRQWYWSMKPEE